MHSGPAVLILAGSALGELLAAGYTHPSDPGNRVIARVLADLGYRPLA